ncbi:hypothetical protein SASPL_134932 [Salvia splendens]|uniref:Amine oxidase domain-containing protein n=1 Tax=Salvia splendens TaxID=180675 RepID=A0A8X8WZ54_SALSN|nr:putative flavin-containing monooxygenase FMO GS-OX-like 11 [Salvia splendens]KAG6402723.1 hypothetical protein SASPL_134932 [Salvia splendens]
MGPADLPGPPLNVAGLVSARALKTEGHRVVVYEKSDRLGGTWAYDPLSLDPDREIVHSRISLWPELNGEVVFEDGAVVHADIILHCTG